MNLTIPVSVDFVRERAEKTRAVQATLATGGSAWIWPKKTMVQWDADLLQLDGAAAGTLAQLAGEKEAVYRGLRGSLETRTGTIHTKTLQAVGVMRARALDDPELRPGVDELSARGDSVRAIEEEGEELLAVWKEDFGTAFVPAPGLTYTAFMALFIGAAGPPVVLSLRMLKTDYKASRAAARAAAGRYNTVINRLWDECVAWYAEVTAVFPAGTDEGDLIRSEVPTIYNPATGGAPSGGGGGSASSGSSSSSSSFNGSSSSSSNGR